MNKLFLLAGLFLYLPFCYASQQPPINFGNFSNQRFTPRGGVVPDTRTSISNSGGTRIDGVRPERDPFQQLAADEPLITVSGNVQKYPDLTRELINASGVEVLFWQPSNPGQTRSAITDENGNYEIALTNGFWRGEACGSGVGYSPNAWEVSLQDNKLIAMQEVSYLPPHITPNQIDLAMLENNSSSDNAISTFLKQRDETLSINGSGFGCNGSLVFVFHNSVNNCSVVNAVEYDHSLIIRNNYDRRSDTNIKIPMPSLYDAAIGQAAQSDDIRRIAKMYYQKGNQRSNSIFVGEYLGEAFAPGVAYEGACLGTLDDQVTDGGQYTDQTGALENLGDLGSGVSGVFTGGGNPAGGPGGHTETPVATGLNATVMSGQEIAIEGNLNTNIRVDNIRLNF